MGESTAIPTLCAARWITCSKSGDKVALSSGWSERAIDKAFIRKGMYLYVCMRAWCVGVCVVCVHLCG